VRGWATILFLALLAAIIASCGSYSASADCSLDCDGGASAKGIRILDAPPVAEGTQAIFEVKLDLVPATDVKVDFATFDGSAKAGEDYVAKSGTLVFAAGSDTQTIKVDIIADATPEPSETFTVRLANAFAAPIARNEAVATILSDNAGPSVTIAGVAAAEGNTGSTSFDFAVSLSTPSGMDVAVTYQTTDGTATSASGDYVDTMGQLVIPAGQTQGTITITVNGDGLNEANETFTVALSNPSNAVLGASSTATATIQNDDDVPTVSIGDLSSTEGNAGTKSFVVPVTLSSPSAQTVTVHYATADGTATAAGNDYTSTSGTIAFNPGVTTQNVIVAVNSDVTDESNETFAINLSSPSNATILDGTASITILNDDGGLPTLSLGNASASEGSSIIFTVTLSAASASTVTVDYATASGTATSSDFTNTSGTLTFTPGQTSKTISISTVADTLYEGNETFVVNLSNPVNANISVPQGTGTIIDDDAKPSLAIDNLSLSEGTGPGTTNFVFTVTMSAAAGVTVTVQYATANGTANSNDFVAVSGTLTFNPGTTSRTITVQVTKDTTKESDETFFVNLSNTTNATIGDTQGVGTIKDDD